MKLKKLGATGAAHIIAPLVALLLIGAVGTYVGLTSKSHAQVEPPRPYWHVVATKHPTTSTGNGFNNAYVSFYHPGYYSFGSRAAHKDWRACFVGRTVAGAKSNTFYVDISAGTGVNGPDKQTKGTAKASSASTHCTPEMKNGTTTNNFEVSIGVKGNAEMKVSKVTLQELY